MRFWRRSEKEDGISCVVRAKDEEEWVWMSLVSILDFADEIIFVDNGSRDQTLALVQELKRSWRIEKLKIFTFPEIDGVRVQAKDLYQFAFGQATRSWVMKWDADFIARTDGLYAISELKNFWYDHRRKWGRIKLNAPNLWGDHAHYRSASGGAPDLCNEGYLFQNRDWFYRMNREYGYEEVAFHRHVRERGIGPWANSADDRRMYWFHLQGVKSDAKIFERTYISRWWKYCLEARGKGLSHDQWLGKEFQTSDRAEMIRRAMRRYFEDGRLERFTKIGGEWGDYPKLMEEYLQNPRYLVLYENGQPAYRETRPIPIPRPAPALPRAKGMEGPS